MGKDVSPTCGREYSRVFNLTAVVSFRWAHSSYQGFSQVFVASTVAVLHTQDEYLGGSGIRRRIGQRGRIYLSVLIYVVVILCNEFFSLRHSCAGALRILRGIGKGIRFKKYKIVLEISLRSIVSAGSREGVEGRRDRDRGMKEDGRFRASFDTLDVPPDQDPPYPDVYERPPPPSPPFSPNQNPQTVNQRVAHKSFVHCPSRAESAKTLHL
ncbi:hypothetical protein C8R42DRAFT_643821 [Lentinula raphanica]|nr:hypothetical protein C8R42DRAFT_643821 [Lentinula raphanica]